MALFWSIMLAVLKSIGAAGTGISVGVIAAKLGILTPATQKSLSEISMKITIPALLFTKILACQQCRGSPNCHRCAPFEQIIRDSWILLLFPFVIAGLGALLGRSAAWLTACPSDFSSGTVCAVAFGNSTGLPIVLLGVLTQAFHQEDMGDLGKVDPLLYLPVFLMSYPMLQWSFGTWLLKKSGKDQDEAGDADRALEAASETTHEAEAVSCRHRFLSRSSALLRLALVPPVVASLTGLIIGLSPLRELFVDTMSQEDHAPLAPLFNGLQMIGQAAIPVNLLVLGASLAKGANFTALPMRVGLAIVICKMVLLPVIMAVVVYISIHVVPLPRPMDSNIYLVALMVSCTPTANNVAVMAQMGGQSKEAMSTAIFLQYLAAPVLVTMSMSSFVFLLRSEAYMGQHAKGIGVR